MLTENPIELDGEPRQKPEIPLIGWTCSYMPVEILEAAGLQAVRIIPEPSTEKADAFLDPNFCPYVRSCLGKAMQGGFSHLDGIIVLNTCDGMRRLYDAWRYYAPASFAFMLDVPRILSPQSTVYFQNQLVRLVSELEKHFEVRVNNDMLLKATGKVNRTRELYSAILSRIYDESYHMPYREILNIFQKEYSMPRELFNEALEQIIQSPQGQGQPCEAGRTRVFITGSMLDGDALIGLVEELGGQIAGVDCCLAERMVRYVPLEKDMLFSLARSYMEKLPCARMKETAKRAGFLLKALKERNARGLIYTTLKFCDPYLYEFPYVREDFEKRGIPVLLVEGEYRGRAGGGLRTRVQAFLEMLEQKVS